MLPQLARTPMPVRSSAALQQRGLSTRVPALGDLALRLTLHTKPAGLLGMVLIP